MSFRRAFIYYLGFAVLFTIWFNWLARIMGAPQPAAGWIGFIVGFGMGWQVWRHLMSKVKK